MMSSAHLPMTNSTVTAGMTGSSVTTVAPLPWRLKTMDNVALIDGDSFLYRAGFAVEKTKYLVEWEGFTPYDTMKEVKAACQPDNRGIVWNRKELGSLDDAVAIMDAMIEGAIRE